MGPGSGSSGTWGHLHFVVFFSWIARCWLPVVSRELFQGSQPCTGGVSAGKGIFSPKASKALSSPLSALSSGAHCRGASAWLGTQFGVRQGWEPSPSLRGTFAAERFLWILSHPRWVWGKPFSLLPFLTVSMWLLL